MLLSTKTTRELLSALPSIDSILGSESGKVLGKQIRRDILTDLAREAVAAIRTEILANHGNIKSVDAVAKKAMKRFEQAVKKLLAPSMRKVINCTGIILHTGLGRAVISREAIEGVN
ncbi:MAG: hypothetical protein ACE5I1_17180, partial [bacterium]